MVGSRTSAIERKISQAKADEELLYLLLDLLSRSFSPGIQSLHKCRGVGEFDKRVIVACAYNILRYVDTIEDSSLWVEDKVRLHDSVALVIDKIARRGKEENIDDLIFSMGIITYRLKEAVRNEQERIFVEHFGRGVVLRKLHSFDAGVKDDINYCTLRMTEGMKDFLHRGEIETTQQLRDYCFSVAGSIGEFLTSLVNSKDSAILQDRELDAGLAQRFGELLQLTNIAKNVREDADARRVFFPVVYRPSKMTHLDLIYGIGDDVVDARKQSLDSVLTLAKDNLEDSVKYVTSIPAGLSGYKAFCIIPFVTAIKTIETMENAGAERVFVGDETAIKIRHGENIIKFCGRLAMNYGGVNANDWLLEYAQNHAAFSFEHERYTRWSHEWLEKIR